MKVEILSRKLVKPWTPTPSHLKTYKISLLDDLIPPLNLGIPLFYASRPEGTSDLEERLSKALVGFYPLAGRFLKKDRAVDCDDQGVEFVLAEAPEVELSDLMGERDVRKLNRDFLRHPVPGAEDPLTSFQLTNLKCGGCVLGISVSHVVLDTSSIKTFLDTWSGRILPSVPNFYAPSLFPCNGDGISGMGADVSEKHVAAGEASVAAKRFLFTAEAVARMVGRGVPRARAVTALISAAIIRLDRAEHGRSRPCMIIQPVNMRGRTIPPLPKHSCGNLAITSSTPVFEAVGIDRLVDLIGEAVDKSVAACGEMLMPGRDRSKMVMEPLNEFIGKAMSGEVNVMWFTDLTKFGFYEADLGWGKPSLVSFSPSHAEKATVLMENRDGGGVDALVHLKTTDMALFEEDEEIKLFATY